MAKDGATVAVMVAVCERRRKLGVPGEEGFNARGVGYCAPCGAPLFRGRAVVGGGEAAAQAASLLAEYASRAAQDGPHYQRLSRREKIEISWNVLVEELGATKR